MTERTSFPQINDEELIEGVTNVGSSLELQHPVIAAMVAAIKSQTSVCDWSQADDFGIIMFALQFLASSESHPQVAALVREFASVLHEQRNERTAEAIKDRN